MDGTPPLRPRNGIGIAERAQHVPVHDLCGGNDFDHVQLVGRQRGQSRPHQVDELRVDPQPTIHAPASVTLDERTVGEGSRQQTAKEQRVSLRHLMQAVNHTVVDVAVEHTSDQLPGLGTGERLDVQAQEQALLPQRGHRIRNLLAGPNGHDETWRSTQRQLLDQQRRQWVEEVGVVDDDDQAVVGRQRAVRGTQHDGRLVGRLDGHSALKRPQRDRLPGLGAQHEPRVQALRLDGLGHRAAERRLADACFTAQRDASQTRVGAQSRQPLD